MSARPTVGAHKEPFPDVYRVGNYHWFLEDFALNRRIRSTRSLARKPTLDGPVNGPSVLRGSVIPGESKILVRENLELALHDLRQKDRDRKLWVDAVCIDQRNEKERGQARNAADGMRIVRGAATQTMVFWL